MKKLQRRIAWGIVIAALAAAPMADAHKDHNGDGGNNSGKRCDTWYRANHESGPSNDKKSEHHTSEFDNGEVAPGVYVHNHTGHYVIRHQDFYLEVIGGGGYNRDGNQGGAVQGEVDAVEGAPDVDFNVNFFAGTNGSMHSEAACVSIADNKIGDQGSQP